MAAVVPCTWNTAEAKELSPESVAVVIDAEYVFSRGLACIAEAHLCKHLFAVGRRAHIEDAGYSSMRLAKRAVSFVAEEGRELAVVILTRFRLAVSIVEGDVEHVILEGVARGRLVRCLHVLCFEVGGVEMKSSVLCPERAERVRATALEDFE